LFLSCCKIATGKSASGLNRPGPRLIRRRGSAIVSPKMATAFKTIVVVVMMAVGAIAQPRDELFARKNLVAWCIVPFDARKRTPEQRAEMLEKLKIHRFAYDWRAEHLPTFEEELAALKRHDIELTAVWFPAAMD